MLTLRALFLTTLLTYAGMGLAAGPVDINNANAAALAEAMTGIGLKRAEAIVEFRKANGPFSSVDDLVFVKGIGSATVEKNREQLTVE